MNVNGGRDNTTNYTVDGVSNLDTGNNGVLGSINLDAVEEFKILTNAYSAEYGRSSGAQVSLVTKSGGRDYRGSVYGYRRQESLNANSFINNRERGRALETDPELDGRPEADQPPDGHRLHRRRPGAARRLQQGQATACSSSSPSRTSGGSRRRPTRTASRCRPQLERQGDFSQSVDNNNRPVQPDPRLPDRPALHRDEHQRLLPGRRRARPHPGQPPLCAGPGHPERLSAAERRAAPATTTSRRSRCRSIGARRSSAPTGRRRRRGASTAATSTTRTTPAPASAPTARSCSAPTCR